MADLKAFLKTVDATVSRDESFVDRAIGVFASNSVIVVEDLVGLDKDQIEDFPRGGLGSFIVRALRKANGSMPAVPPAVDAAAGSSSQTHMSALIQALSKQEHKVHIDLVDKLSRSIRHDLDTRYHYVDC